MTISRKICFEAGYDKCKKDINRLIDKQIKKCKDYIKLNKKLLKLTEMTNKEWIKGRIDECEYTIDMLKELKSRINGENKK